jgi:uncharacterized protein YbjT (DUF2867 family)
MILITGATGKTGSTAVARLWAQKQPMRALVRSEDKGRSLREKGAEIVIGSLEVATDVRAALAGVKSVYFLVPPDPATTDMIGRGKRIADVFTAALKDSAVEHVVLLSSIGAQHEVGTGPIQMLHYAEQRIAATGRRLTALRAAYFMENVAGMIGLMQAQGILPCSFDPRRKIPMIASADVGAAAADALLAPPAANDIVDVEGPAPLSYEDVAAAFGEALGKPVKAVPMPREAVIPALIQAGFSENVASVYGEMAEAVDKGLLTYEGGTRRVRGTITITQLAKELVAR